MKFLIDECLTVELSAIAWDRAGLICLSAVPRFMNKELQKLLFEHALELLRGKDLVNRVLEITLDADAEVRSRWYANSDDYHDDGRLTQ